MKQEIEMVVQLINDDLDEYDDIIKMKIKELLMYIIKSDSSGDIYDFVHNCSRSIDNDFRKYVD